MKAIKFILLGIVILAAITFALRSIDLRNKYYVVMDIAKVSRNDLVKFNGVNVGNVSNIDLNGAYKAVIEIRVKRGVAIPRASIVKYENSRTLLPDTWIEIENKSRVAAPFYKNSDSIIGNSDSPPNNVQTELMKIISTIMAAQEHDTLKTKKELGIDFSSKSKKASP